MGGITVMRIPFSIVGSLLINSLQAHSLFFSNPQLAKIEQDTNPRKWNSLHLKGITYLGPKNWTIWLNKVVIHSSTPSYYGLSVEHVTPTEVQLKWNGEDHPFVLNIHQVLPIPKP